MDIKAEIIKTIDERFKVLKDSLEFDRTYYGKVISIDGNKAVVSVSGIEYNASIIRDISLSINDVVICKAPNGNFSYLYIDGVLGNCSQMSLDNIIDELNNKASKSYVDEQDGILNDKLTVLSPLIDRGYLNTAITPNGTDFNTIKTNGNYYANAWVHTNIPTLTDGTRLTGVVNVYFVDGVTYQTLNTNNGKWYREEKNGVWSTWENIATTSKLDVSSGLLNGWMLENYRTSTVSVSGNIVSISLSLKGGVFTYNTPILTLPTNIIPKIAHDLNATYFDGTSYQAGRVYVNNDGKIHVVQLGSNNYVNINATYSL